MTKLFRYYQKNEKGRWESFEYNPTQNWEKELRAKGAVRATILAVDHLFTKNDSNKASYIAYTGDFYMDLDGDTPMSKHSAVLNILKKLKEDYGIPEGTVKIYLSGKKGYHIIVPKKCFSLRGTESLLPAIYKEMCKTLTKEADLQVYSFGKGVCWRLTGIPREGSGVMRTQITYEELVALTDAKYKSLVRDDTRPLSLDTTPPVRSIRFESLYESCKKEVIGSQVKESTIVKNSTELGDKIPDCIIELCGTNLPIKSYHDASLQLAAYLANSGQPDDSPLIDKFIANRGGMSDRTGSLEEGFEATLRSVKANSTFQFGCGYIKSVFNQNISHLCLNCPVANKELTDSKEGFSILLDFTEGGTFLLYPYKDNTRKRVTTTCHLIPDRLYVDKDNLKLGVGVVFTIKHLRKKTLTTLTIPPSEFSNLTFCMNVFRANGILVTSEFRKMYDDFILAVQNTLELRATVDSSHEGAEISETLGNLVVDEFGFHSTPKGKVYWVSPSGTFEPNGMRNILQVDLDQAEIYQGYLKQEVHHPRIFSRGRKEEYSVAITNLLNLRDPLITSSLLGWFIACWLNPILQNVPALDLEFPLLTITGQSESGKSTILELFTKLVGQVKPITTMYGRAGVTLAGGTNTISSSCHQPVIFEEVNDSKSQFGGGSLKEFLEMIKNVWNHDRVIKSKGANQKKVVTITPKNPAILVGEVPVITESLSHRSISVNLRTMKQVKKPKWVNANNELAAPVRTEEGIVRRADSLLDTADYMFHFLGAKQGEPLIDYLFSLRDSCSRIVENRLRGQEIDARKKISITRVIQGITLFKDMAQEYGLPISESLDKLLANQHSIIDFHVGNAVSGVGNKSESGYVRKSDGEELISALLAFAKSDMESAILLSDRDFKPKAFSAYSLFIVKDGYLVLDSVLAFEMLKGKVKDTTNFALNSFFDFTQRLQTISYEGTNLQVESPSHILFDFDDLQNKNIVDADEFMNTCDTYVEILKKYNSMYRTKFERYFIKEDKVRSGVW